jgi:hypothetical protein
MQILQEQISALPMTARDGGNAKRLSGTIFAIHVGNAEDRQKDQQWVGYLLRVALHLFYLQIFRKRGT